MTYHHTQALYFLVIFLIIILSACGGLSDAGKVLRNEKKATNDEFLVEKNEITNL